MGVSGVECESEGKRESGVVYWLVLGLKPSPFLPHYSPKVV